MSEQTYLIRRFYFDETHPDHHAVIMHGLTEAQAQEYCQSELTHEVKPNGDVVWFDGYERE